MKNKTKVKCEVVGGLPPSKLFSYARGLKEAALKVAREEQLWLKFDPKEVKFIQ